jgi:hypothetical protein
MERVYICRQIRTTAGPAGKPVPCIPVQFRSVPAGNVSLPVQRVMGIVTRLLQTGAKPA